jgi:hypothetical protein
LAAARVSAPLPDTVEDRQQINVGGRELMVDKISRLGSRPVQNFSLQTMHMAHVNVERLEPMISGVATVCLPPMSASNVRQAVETG